MITRLKAMRYRCFERLGVDVGDFRVLSVLHEWFPSEVPV